MYLLQPPTRLGSTASAQAWQVSTTQVYHKQISEVHDAAFIARKLCPELILVKNTFSRYSEMSRKVMSVFKRYDPNMMAAGCDEGYLKCVSSQVMASVAGL